MASVIASIRGIGTFAQCSELTNKSGLVIYLLNKYKKKVQLCGYLRSEWSSDTADRLSAAAGVEGSKFYVRRNTNSSRRAISKQPWYTVVPIQIPNLVRPNQIIQN